jgi:hypothetical protein
LDLNLFETFLEGRSFFRRLEPEPTAGDRAGPAEASRPAAPDGPARPAYRARAPSMAASERLALDIDMGRDRQGSGGGTALFFVAFKAAP